MNKSTLPLIAAAFAAVTTVGAAENILAAGEWKATAYPQNIKKALDGKMDTNWISYAGNNAFATLTCTLPEAVNFQVLTLIGNNLAGGEIEISENGTDWKTLGELKSTSNGGMLSYNLAEPVSAKAIRLKIKGFPDKKAPLDIREMAAYIPDAPINLASFCSIDETGVGLNWRYPARFLVDGNSLTFVRPYSGYKGSTFTVDLGESKDVSSVGFIARRAFDKVTVSTSADGKTWAPAGSGEKIAGDKLLEFPKANTRYLKIEVQGHYSCNPSELIVR